MLLKRFLIRGFLMVAGLALIAFGMVASPMHGEPRGATTPASVATPDN